MHAWYERYYRDYNGELVLKKIVVPEELVARVRAPFTRPSLVPIEAASDTKLYNLIPDFGLYLGSQDAAHNDEVFFKPIIV